MEEKVRRREGEEVERGRGRGRGRRRGGEGEGEGEGGQRRRGGGCTTHLKNWVTASAPCETKERTWTYGNCSTAKSTVWGDVTKINLHECGPR